MSSLSVERTEKKSQTITVKKHTIVLNVQRSDLIEVKESSDGIIFQLKGGIDFSVTDLMMPLEVKRTIKISVDKFENNDIVIDLMNYIKPVMVQG